MIKYLFMLIGMFLFINYNMIGCFLYNILFFMSIMFCFKKMNLMMYDLDISVSSNLMVDYYSFNLILLSFWVMGLVVMVDNKKFNHKMFLTIMIILFFFFSLKNFLLFYLVFEISLVPIFFVITYFGYNLERLSAAYYMLMYMFLISLPLLIYIMSMYKVFGSLNFFLMGMMDYNLSFWGFFIIIGAFLIKMPMFLFHVWLPKAHLEAPVYGSMILSAILLKLGSYGLVRILKIFISSGVKYMSYYISVGLIGSIVISGVCLVQVDMKSLVAYSSVVHMNLMLCSLMSLTKVGFVVSYIIMISHGLCSSGLFFMVNLFYKQSSSRLFLLNKGMINLLTCYMLMWFLLCVLNFSFPISISFFGEIFMIGVLMKLDMIVMVYLVLVSFLSSAYSLYLYLYVSHGELVNMEVSGGLVGSVKEMIVVMMHIFPLMIMVFNMNMF